MSKTIYAEPPPRSEYAITDIGRSLLPFIDAMIEWGEEHVELFKRKENGEVG